MSRFTLACLLLSFAALVTLLLPSRRATTTAAEGRHADVRVGLVFDVGGRGDKSFNDSAYAGLTRAQQDLGVTDRDDRAERRRGSRGGDAVVRGTRIRISSSGSASSSPPT